MTNPEDVTHLVRARQAALDGTGKRLRESSGLSLRHVGDLCGVTASTVFRWERAERRPSGDPAVRWVKLLGRLERLQRTARVSA